MNDNIKLVKPGFLAGKEKLFKKFLENLHGEKVGLISHVTDLDGVVSAKVVGVALKNVIVKFVDYSDINDSFVQELKSLGLKKIILTDLMITNIDPIKQLEEFADVLIIDHHPFQIDYNSAKTVFINSQGYCAAYICYYLFSKYYELTKLDWLVVCASISDFQYKRNKKWMSAVYKKYRQSFKYNKSWVDNSTVFFKLMNTLSLAISYFKPKTEKVYSALGVDYADIGDLERYSQAIQHEIDVMTNRFEKEKVDFKEGYFFEFECIFSIRSYIVTKISLVHRNKTVIIGEKKGQSYWLSARRQDHKKDVDKLLKQLTLDFKNSTAGGHFVSAGASFSSEYIDEFKKRLKSL